MGSDNFRDLDKWKDYKDIIGSCKIFIYLRPGFPVENKFNADIAVLSAPMLNISSTEIRKLVKEGKSIRYLVPDAVRLEIVEKRHYRK
jgi:nicotinate-nucleotide adenylyltransferase